jgi:hypothetical protein
MPATYKALDALIALAVQPERNFANMRAILYFPAEKVKTVDWLADDAGLSEPFS